MMDQFLVSRGVVTALLAFGIALMIATSMIAARAWDGSIGSVAVLVACLSVQAAFVGWEVWLLGRKG